MSFFNELFSAPYWGYIIFGNELRAFALALIFFVALLIAFYIFQAIVLNRLNKLAKKTETEYDNALLQIVESIRPPFYSFLAFYFATLVLNFNDTVRRIITIVLLAWVVYQAIIALQLLIDFFIKRKVTEEGEDTAKSAIGTMGNIAKAVLWLLGLLFMLSNLGVNVTSVVAGLGIGGIAVAFALQNILSDLFSSFAIYFDKPFKVGDFIVVGEHLGTVERIGIKTTRLRALQGEEIVISNKELTSTRVQNFKKMQERRIAFSFGVTYQTPSKKMEHIPGMVKEIIEEIKEARIDRVHFKQFADSALSFEVVYYVLSPDYNKYMDIQQEINLKIKQAFEKESIEMAYPTQTIYLAKS